MAAIRDGLGLFLWQHESFAYVDSYDEEKESYRGLRTGLGVSLATDSFPNLLVKPKVAVKQQKAEAPPPSGPVTGAAGQSEATVISGQPDPGVSEGRELAAPPVQPKPGPRRFYGSVTLDSSRVGRDAGRIADEVIAHVVGLVGARVTVTLEIMAEISDGVPEHVIRTVTENCSLGFQAILSIQCWSS